MGERIKMPLFKAQTVDGSWVYGNLIITEDAIDEYQAIIIPREDNGLFTKEDISYPVSGSDRAYLKERGLVRFESEDLGFQTWHRVDINTIQIINE
ncbi:hypothetical protein [Paenibacillus sp. FSL P4-0288]|uniref:hypothetical protein n=1 Tax=Paenibacillus sp. FSL P4-0288 TaxID=2921633 RepID=UPI0030F84A6D